MYRSHGRRQSGQGGGVPSLDFHTRYLECVLQQLSTQPTIFSTKFFFRRALDAAFPRDGFYWCYFSSLVFLLASPGYFSADALDNCIVPITCEITEKQLKNKNARRTKITQTAPKAFIKYEIPF